MLLNHLGLRRFLLLETLLEHVFIGEREHVDRRIATDEPKFEP